MRLTERFGAFLQTSPISVMMRLAIERVICPERLNAIFENRAEQQYARELEFSTIVDLLAEVVFNERPSLHKAILAAGEDLPVSVTSVYNKTNGVESVVCDAVVAETAADFGAIIQELDAADRPLLDGYDVRIVDGNHFAKTERRLKPLRQHTAAPLPGHAIAVLDPRLRLATHMIGCHDGHASERSLIAGIVGLVQPNELWIADRNFCTKEFFAGIINAGGFVVVRQHAASQLLEVTVFSEPGQHRGAAISEQLVEFTGPNRTMLRMRRIRIELPTPTRDGDYVLHVLTNVPVEDAGACQIADLYRKRWRVETMFQDLSQSLHTEIRTLGYPNAAALAFALGLVGYNVLSVVVSALAVAQLEAEATSTEATSTDTASDRSDAVAGSIAGLSRNYIISEFCCTQRGMLIALPKRVWASARKLSTTDFVTLLLEVASHVRIRQFRKNKRGPRTPGAAKKTGSSAHVSTYRELQKAKANTRKAP